MYVPNNRFVVAGNIRRCAAQVTIFITVGDALYSWNLYNNHPDSRTVELLKSICDTNVSVSTKWAGPCSDWQNRPNITLRFILSFKNNLYTVWIYIGVVQSGGGHTKISIGSHPLMYRASGPINSRNYVGMCSDSYGFIVKFTNTAWFKLSFFIIVFDDILFIPCVYFIVIQLLAVHSCKVPLVIKTVLD